MIVLEESSTRTSTEYYGTAGMMLIVFLLARLIDPRMSSMCVFVLYASYVIGRTLRKKNRAKFHRGIFTSEFHFLLMNQMSAFLGWKYYTLPLEWALIMAVAGQVLWNKCRGVTNSIGVKTQMVFK